MRISRLVESKQTVTIERLDEHIQPRYQREFSCQEADHTAQSSEGCRAFPGVGTLKGSTRLEQIDGAPIKAKQNSAPRPLLRHTGIAMI